MKDETTAAELCVLVLLLGNFGCGCAVTMAGLFSGNFWHLAIGLFVAFASTVAAYFIEEKHYECDGGEYDG